MGNKRSLRLVLIAAAAIIMIFTMTAAVFAESSGSLNGNINWTLDDSGTLTITGTGAMPDYSNSSDTPFYNNQNIKAILIENGITEIGSRTFGGLYEVQSVSLPDGLTRIGGYAFGDMMKLSKIVIPDSVTSLGDRVFSYCQGLKTVKLPSGLKKIPEGTFAGDYKLKNIEIPEGVEVIENEAFFGCSDLSKITIPASINSLIYCFIECHSLDEVTFLGDFPEVMMAPFWACNITAYYPLGNATWTDEVIDSGYGGKIEWVGYCAAHQNAAAVKENVKEATALKPGSYDMVVRCKLCNEVVSRETVAVKKLTPTIKLSAKKKTLKKGKSYTLKTSGLAKGDSVKSYKSSKKAVATVTKKGKIKAKKKGKTVITVTLTSGKTAKCRITVK